MKAKLFAVILGLTLTISLAAGQLQPPAPPTDVRLGTQASLPIWGVADPAILGNCSQSVHDSYTLNGGDGFRYRTWHPQVDPSGCIFGHEHGDDPRRIGYAEIAARPVMFGYIGRRMPMPGEPNGHEEPHEGFKVFVANPGETNNEDRINRVYSRSVFHMGTGGPRRFTLAHHSADIAVYHPEFGLKAYTRVMMDTGDSETICVRGESPFKTVLTLTSGCVIDSMYEIWSTQGIIRGNGREVYRVFATPAVFDPITVFDPANPTRVLYAWDPAVNGIFRFPDDRRWVRGCDRESYAQPGYWYNEGSGRETYYTDAMGNEVSPSAPGALAQYISQHNSIGAPATNDGLVQYKVRRSWCQNISSLGYKN